MHIKEEWVDPEWLVARELTQCELDIVLYLPQGKKRAKIGSELFISGNTVKKYIGKLTLRFGTGRGGVVKQLVLDGLTAEGRDAMLGSPEAQAFKRGLAGLPPIVIAVLGELAATPDATNEELGARLTLSEQRVKSYLRKAGYACRPSVDQPRLLRTALMAWYVLIKSSTP